MNDREANDLVLNIWAVFPNMFKLIRQSWQKGSEYSVYHYEIIGILLQKGSMSMTEIGRFLGISKPNITPLIDKLVNNGLVNRITDTDDRRIVKVSITEKGRSFLQDGKEKTIQDYKKIFSEFTPEETDKLIKSLSEVRGLFLRIENKEV